MTVKSFFRRAARWALCVFGLLLVVLLIAFLVFFRGALYNRFVAFPREAAAWEEIRGNLSEVVLPYHVPWTEYRGIAHNHTELSHDSEVPFELILQVLKDIDCDFIALSDHCLENGTADYSAQWRGIHDGKLFIPGYEMKYGFMPWRLADAVVLDCDKAPAALAAEIEAKGGLLFIAHPEEKREWHLPQIAGMEIYNIHADFKDEEVKELAPDILLNLRAYPDQTFRLIFDRNTHMLAHWDDMNRERDITGIAANDCHQNNGIYGIYTDDGSLLVKKSSGDVIGNYRLNVVTRTLLRLLPGALEAGKEVFRLQVDPYSLMSRYVNTHVLATELSEAAVLDAFAEGRVFIGFDMIANSSGFMFLARSDTKQAVMGERIALGSETFLVAAAPHTCRFTVLRHGVPVHQETGLSIRWPVNEPGKYRVEAELDILDEWVPWIYANPIEITERGGDAATSATPPDAAQEGTL